MIDLHFNEKIECIYKYIANSNINELTKLFYVRGAKASFENRKSYIRKKWLKKEAKALIPKTFKRDYFKYDFAHLDTYGKRIFYDANEFLYIPLDEFCKRVKDYQAQYIKLDEKFIFKYLYLYEDEEINYFKLNFIKNIGYNKTSIEALYKDKVYNGEIELSSYKIVLTLHSNSYYINAIFSSDLLEENFSIGVANCINRYNKTPIAKKVILSKKNLLKEKILPLILNKNEILKAKENSYLLNNKLDKKIYKNSVYTIKNISQLLNTHFYKKSDFYKLLALKELEATSSLLEKTLYNNSYYVYYKKRILEQAINSYSYKKYKKLYIIYPLTPKDYIFSQISKASIEFQEQLLKLAKKVKIEIIFVMQECKQELTNDFFDFLKRASDFISIFFIDFKNIKTETETIDMVFTSNKDFVSVKFLRNHFDEYDIFIDSHHIKKFESTFLTLKNRSKKYTKNSKLCEE